MIIKAKLDDAPARQMWNEGVQALSAGRLDEAKSAGRKLCESAGNKPHGWWLLSLSAQQQRDPVAAEVCAQRALQLAPEEITLQINYARCLVLSGRLGGALELIQHLRQADVLVPEDLDAVGSIFSHCGKADRALPWFVQAVNAQPGNFNFLYNLASAQRMAGALDSAIASCERLVQAAPSHHDAWFLLADLRRWNEHDNHIAILRDRLAHGDLLAPQEVTLRFALAKELEDCKQFEAAFEQLHAANALRRRHMRYRLDADLDMIDVLLESHNKETLSRAEKINSPSRPIFVLGLPRSGTTLVERILASHSEVQTLGEIPYFAMQVDAAARQVTAGTGSRSSRIRAVAGADKNVLAQAYLDNARQLGIQSPFFIDKMPINYLHIGLICACFPSARIIMLRRDPLDSCYAMYKTLFTNHYPFTYDLEELGRYYLHWHKLMEHWLREFPEQITQLRYEELVSAPEPQIRRILAACDLGWEEQCLQFHQLRLPSATASAAQIRSPIHADSVGRWRHFSEKLAPLQALLREAGLVSGT